ncbi:MAG: transporter ATP-binding protein [Rickettsiaceae bacterium]|jgi:phospholipid/cholesterol/gamma-HCH transport system ATP-binding protein|nr:transporter ATP-binding protein [Rickettsiaceae bacterium]
MSSPVISLRDVHKSFGSKKVLKGINLDIAKGESLVVIGGSGSGKSVLIKNIIGLMEPTSGSIKIDGEEVSHLSSRARSNKMSKFGVLFQGGALFDSLPVWRNISFALMQSGKMNADEAYKLAVSKLASVGLKEDVANLSPSELSGGMQKRVALARAIASNPEIIFFDEPTTGLDPIMADVINNLITKCSSELGATTFTITHDMHSVRKIADKVAMIYDGVIVWYGKVDEMDTCDNEMVQQFIHGRAEGPIKMQVQDH